MDAWHAVGDLVHRLWELAGRLPGYEPWQQTSVVFVVLLSVAVLLLAALTILLCALATAWHMARLWLHERWTDA